jgi:nitroreductase
MIRPTLILLPTLVVFIPKPIPLPLILPLQLATHHPPDHTAIAATHLIRLDALTAVKEQAMKIIRQKNNKKLRGKSDA